MAIITADEVLTNLDPPNKKLNDAMRALQVAVDELEQASSLVAELFEPPRLLEKKERNTGMMLDQSFSDYIYHDVVQRIWGLSGRVRHTVTELKELCDEGHAKDELRYSWERLRSYAEKWHEIDRRAYFPLESVTAIKGRNNSPSEV